MDIQVLQQFADQFHTMTCIMSVEAFPDGSYGNIRIVIGNKSYLDSIRYFNRLGMPELLESDFVPNSPYERYIPKDLNFEDACYRSAVLRQAVHAYIHPDRYDFWFNIVLMPIEMTDGNTHYCTYSQEITQKADTAQMSNHSQKIASDVLNTCVKLRGTSDFRSTMDEVIHDIRLLCDAESCCILMTDFKEKSSVLLSHDMREGSTRSVPDTVANADFYHIAATWSDTIAGSNCLIIKNEQDMEIVRERNPAWHDSLCASGVKSIVLFPLQYGKETVGYIWATNFNTEETARIKETLELTTFFLASEIANYQLFSRLEKLSSTDLLTGVKNRNAMNNRIDALCSEQEGKNGSIGVIFADLNGLKEINDNKGHFAGDMLLKKAALILQDNFADQEIYRAGGDEFMVLTLGLTEAELQKKIAVLSRYYDDPEMVSFAIGVCYDKTGSDIRRAMRLADERMYEHKQRYYEAHPERKRK